MTNPSEIPFLASAVTKTLNESNDPWVSRTDEHIRAFNALIAKLPKQYRWRFRTVEAFNAEVENVAETSSDCLAVNQLYWRDQLGCCEAYALLSTWRMVDLARGCIWALARNDIVGAALLARSGLENAAQFADVARSISAKIIGTSEKTSHGRLLEPSIDFRKSRVVSQDFEDLMLRTLFATRLPNTDEFYQARNIVGIIERVSKIAHQGGLAGVYAQLCEIAHPNFLGKSIYLLGGEPGSRAGEELRTIGQGAGPTSKSFVEASVSALSWGCGTNVTAFQLLSGTIQAVVHRLEIA